jgi:hypothetical protein
MRFAFYCGVLLVAAASVVFGLDWMSAPMPAMPEAKNVVFVPPPPPPPPRVVVQAPAVAPNPPAALPRVAAPAPAPQTTVAEAPSAPPVAAMPALKCDVDACARAYRSFQASDCTYNPSVGPRRLCTKGDPEKYAREHAPSDAAASPPEPVAAPAAPPAEPTAEPPGSIVTPELAAPPAAGCNVSACAAAYPRSFKQTDCTFQPNIGPRKLCEK